MTDLTNLKNLNETANQLARRWVKAWGDYSGYNCSGGATINLNINKIEFYASPTSSGMTWKQWIDIKYLDDSTTLEQDSKKWYDGFHKSRTERFNKIRELENNELVQEYIKLKNQNTYPTTEYFMGNMAGIY